MSLRVSPILSIYLGRQFLIWFGIVFLALAGLLLMFDTLELIRRTASRPDATFVIAIEMALLKLSDTSQKCVPFAVLFGALLAFWRLNRSHEFVVARAAGVSAWQFLLPALACAVLIGAFKIMVVNPLASVLLLRYDQMEAKYIEGRPSLLAVSSTGLWLRQADSRGQYIVHAIRVSPHDMEFNEVTVYLFEGIDRFSGRIDAPRAWLTDGSWVIRDARMTLPNGTVETYGEYRLRTDLSPATIYDSFAAPETMSFWNLPSFISQLEEAGFSGLRHRLYWYAQLADPLLLCAMILIAATFALRPGRRRSTGLVIAAGIGTGFVLYFLTSVVFALGETARVPVLLAAWTPAGVATLLGLALLFHLEDG
jgi:lipopolysaccharide export system permease protein